MAPRLVPGIISFHGATREKGQVLRTVVIALGLLLAAPAWAQSAEKYPDRQVRIIVPYPPGGSTDVLARLMGAHIGAQLGQTVIV